MSFLTALSLSLNNLMTKKGRTFMTSFAGSIGIIGIALILSLSNGVQAYIDTVQQDTLTSYPITIAAKSVDISSMLTAMSDASSDKDEAERDADLIYSRDQMYTMLELMTSQVKTNNLAEFKKYIEESEKNAAEGEDTIASLSSAVSYSYDIEMTLYSPNTDDGILQVNPGTVFQRIGMADDSGTSSSMMTMTMNTDVWQELIDNDELLHSQYEVLAGSWPQSYNEVVLMVSENNEISDYTLYTLGLKDASELEDLFSALMSGDGTTVESDAKEAVSYTYDELLSLSYKLVPSVDTYESKDGMWIDKSGDEEYMKQVIADAPDIKVVGIVRAASTSASSSDSGGIGYTTALTDYMIQHINESEIVQAQINSPDTDVFTGKPFSTDSAIDDFDMSVLPAEQQAYLSGLSDEARREVIASYAGTSAATYEGNLEKLQSVDTDDPSGINIYPSDFEAKEKICDLIAEYNQRYTDEGKDEYVINYTDVVGLMMSSVTTIINAISYVLIAFVSISLIVSSIMIGIITYISVLERTKEIGILRSIGASKKDISRVFNAETLLIGCVSGLIGIGVTVLLCVPASMIIEHFTGIGGLAKLPAAAGVILVLISMALTLIAGLFPSGVAARKDPVDALRSE
jgi:putative ABC transport system permease protein